MPVRGTEKRERDTPAASVPLAHSRPIMLNIVLVIIHIYLCIYVTWSLWAARRAEGASNCVERHLNLNGRDTSLIWTYSQVGRNCCFHSQSATLGAPRSLCNVHVYGAGDNSKKLQAVLSSQRWSKKKRTWDRITRKSASHDATYARKKTYIRYSRRSGESMQYPALRKWPRNLAFSWSHVGSTSACTALAAFRAFRSCVLFLVPWLWTEKYV